ncbi:MAG TPA: branched-chain amino acid ABC transporter substrate-binding protein [Solirubrobacteraceae bacterium]|nr:branched-chain amino acid ABC transporter substrate-binding protein [Solirubrobacteraceae bacterium]
MRLRLSHPALLLLALALCGCGTIAVSANPDVPGNHVSVYTSVPLEGLEAPVARQIVRGEQLALDAAGGRAGPMKVSLVVLNDANPQSGQWDPGLAASNARLAAQDNDAIAYIGDLASGASAVALPLTNGASIPQIAPGSPYIGLTSSEDAGQYDPQRFYPSGKMTFLRLFPADPVEARADVAFLRTRGIHSLYVLSNEDSFNISLAELLREDAAAAGIAVAASERVHIGAGGEPAEFASLAEKVADSGAQAVFFSGPDEGGTVALFRALYARDPRLLLLGSHQLANDRFAARIGPAGASSYFGSPWLTPAAYPPAARALLVRYTEAFHEEGKVYALYGYEAMQLVLDALVKAGAHDNQRSAVTKSLYALSTRHSLLGRYAIEPDGETTLSRYEIEAVAHGETVPLMLLSAPGG